jgi:hypothetical protein
VGDPYDYSDLRYDPKIDGYLHVERPGSAPTLAPET